MKNPLSHALLAVGFGLSSLLFFVPAALTPDVAIIKTSPLSAAPGANLTHGIEVLAKNSAAAAQNV